MKRGALVNLLIGITIAILPLYVRVAALDFNRIYKSNLLVVIFSLFGFILPAPSRKLSFSMWASLIYGLFLLIANQWNVLSLNVMFQIFYISSGMIFFAQYYEKHDSDSTHFILKGMIPNIFPLKVIGLPSFHCEITRALKKYCFVFSGLVSARQTSVGVAFRVICFLTMNSFMIVRI